jgi:hypothetical protein
MSEPGDPGETATVEDNFFSPRNIKFYSTKSPYFRLKDASRFARFLIHEYDDTDGETRVRTGSDRISLEFSKSLSLTQAKVGYFALSYAAGSYQNTEMISVDGRDFNAFATLANGLRCVRDHFLPKHCEGAPKPIWADQICINQSNLDERAKQVMVMRDIYSNAIATLVYLGDDERARKGFGFLKKVLRQFQSYEKRLGGGFASALPKTIEWLIDYIRDPNNSDGWMAAMEIFNLPWWNRAWIYQEVIVANEVYFLCGEDSMIRGHFGAMWYAVQNTAAYIGDRLLRSEDAEFGGHSEHLQDFVFRMSEVMDKVEFLEKMAQKHKSQSQRQKLSDLLRSNRFRDATDPRDKLYALVGLVDPEYGIVPQYRSENTLSRAFTDAAEAIILKENSLDILFDTGEEHRTSGLPSWVPDWSSKDAVEGLPSRHGRKETQDDDKEEPDNPILFPRSNAQDFRPTLRTRVVILGPLAPKASSWFRGNPNFSSASNFDTLKEALFGGSTPAEGDPYARGGSEEDVLGQLFNYLLPAKKEEPISSNYPALRNLRHGEDPRSLDRDSFLPHVLSSALQGKWCFFRNSAGFVGVASARSRFNDLLCLSTDASKYLVLRPDGDAHRFVGGAWLVGQGTEIMARLMTLDPAGVRSAKVDIV